ncbi:recombinase family protein [Promicromonospora umidemergens]|uniref:recombinase family protein n=1 Tax=Promicromonospora umidemergens TaxID=629679 RepID=UPI0020A4C08A|nr:recombinase family protein [Promicromonospora umidemergens]
MTHSEPALLYLRISVNRTAEHASIDQQRDDCLRLAKRLGHTRTITFIDEAVSAYQERARPAYRRLLDHLARRVGTATVIVWHLDRLYRRPADLEELLDLLDTRAARVETVQGGGFDLNTHEGRLFARQLVAFANYESAHKGARVARAQQQRAAQGLLHGGSHYGYRDDGTLHPVHRPVLRRIIEDYLIGVGVSSIARELTQAEVPTPTGNTVWGYTTVRAILASDRLHQRSRSHPGRWRSVVTPIESALIRAQLIAPRSDAARSSSSLLGGIARCAACRTRMVTGVNRHARRRYFCPNVRTCSARARIDGDQLDAIVHEGLHAELSSGQQAVGLLCDTDELLSTLENATADLNGLAEQYGTARLTREELLQARTVPLNRIESCVEELLRHRRARILQSDPEVLLVTGQIQLYRQRALVDAIFAELLVHAHSTGARTRLDVVLRI